MNIHNLILECSKTEDCVIENFSKAQLRSEFVQTLEELSKLDDGIELPFTEEQLPMYKNGDDILVEMDMLAKFMKENDIAVEEAMDRICKYARVDDSCLKIVIEDSTREFIKESKCGSESCKTEANNKMGKIIKTLKDKKDKLVDKIVKKKPKCKKDSKDESCKSEGCKTK